MGVYSFYGFDLFPVSVDKVRTEGIRRRRRKIATKDCDEKKCFACTSTTYTQTTMAIITPNCFKMRCFQLATDSQFKQCEAMPPTE